MGFIWGFIVWGVLSSYGSLTPQGAQNSLVGDYLLRYKNEKLKSIHFSVLKNGGILVKKWPSREQNSSKGRLVWVRSFSRTNQHGTPVANIVLSSENGLTTEDFQVRVVFSKKEDQLIPQLADVLQTKTSGDDVKNILIPQSSVRLYRKKPKTNRLIALDQLFGVKRVIASP
ncbi:MAG: hypothetical protein CL678_05340 [Bdellovibrionaceae bacterium]|nr:hypothetical protein [Pseudobdellovibrionaceae bacterium]|tara:strand:- start:1523 stop:2038 length:516 start_codon:yes stop_codon:yes gene_type:complete